jgi:hypothetical protein
MKEAYLEVTYRHGRLLAAYFYLPRNGQRKSVRTRRVDPGLIIDFAANGRPFRMLLRRNGGSALAAELRR